MQTSKRSIGDAAITAFLNAPTAYLYVGQPKRALFAFLAIGGFVLASDTGFGGRLFDPSFGFALELAFFALIGAFMIDCALLAAQSQDYELRWYNSGKVYAAVVATTLALLLIHNSEALAPYRAAGLYGFSIGAEYAGLADGDKVIANRRAYIDRNPKFGELVFFTRPGESSAQMRRVIGLPGDTVAIDKGVAIVNGVAVSPRPKEASVVRASLDRVYVPKDTYLVVADLLLERPGGKFSERLLVPRQDIFARAEWIFWSWDYARLGAALDHNPWPELAPKPAMPPIAAKPSTAPNLPKAPKAPIARNLLPAGLMAKPAQL